VILNQYVALACQATGDVGDVKLLDHRGGVVSGVVHCLVELQTLPPVQLASKQQSQLHLPSGQQKLTSKHL
jgi:hypothetical protein